MSAMRLAASVLACRFFYLALPRSQGVGFWAAGLLAQRAPSKRRLREGPCPSLRVTGLNDVSSGSAPCSVLPFVCGEVGGRCEGVCGGSEIKLTSVRNATRGVRSCIPCLCLVFFAYPKKIHRDTTLLTPEFLNTIGYCAKPGRWLRVLSCTLWPQVSWRNVRPRNVGCGKVRDPSLRIKARSSLGLNESPFADRFFRDPCEEDASTWSFPARLRGDGVAGRKPLSTHFDASAAGRSVRYAFWGLKQCWPVAAGGVHFATCSVLPFGCRVWAWLHLLSSRMIASETSFNHLSCLGRSDAWWFRCCCTCGGWDPGLRPRRPEPCARGSWGRGCF